MLRLGIAAGVLGPTSKEGSRGIAVQKTISARWSPIAEEKAQRRRRQAAAVACTLLLLLGGTCALLLKRSVTSGDLQQGGGGSSILHSLLQARADRQRHDGLPPLDIVGADLSFGHAGCRVAGFGSPLPGRLVYDCGMCWISASRAIWVQNRHAQAVREGRSRADGR